MAPERMLLTCSIMCKWGSIIIIITWYCTCDIAACHAWLCVGDQAAAGRILQVIIIVVMVTSSATPVRMVKFDPFGRFLVLGLSAPDELQPMKYLDSHTYAPYCTLVSHPTDISGAAQTPIVLQKIESDKEFAVLMLYTVDDECRLHGNNIYNIIDKQIYVWKLTKL